MKRYFVSAGLVVMSFIYLFSQQAPKSDATTTAARNTDTGSSPTGSGTSPTYPIYSTSTTNTTNTTDTTKANTTVHKGAFKDGSYTGTSADAYYGNVQVKAVVTGGKLTSVQILDYPSDRSTSRYINSQALPYLVQEAITAQSANIDTISGASDTSMAFRESLSSALTQAAV